jgi:Hypothetical glycosyl hydrolase family 15
MTSGLAFGAALVISLGAIVPTPLPPATIAQAPIAYPRLAMYSAFLPTGEPYLRDSSTIDTAVVREQAKWDVVVIDAGPPCDLWPGVVTLLRRFNPSIKILGLVAGHYSGIWWNPTRGNPNSRWPDTLRSFQWKYWQAVRNTNGVLYDTLGKVCTFYLANVNLANRATTLALADTITNYVIRSGLYDGLFLDLDCPSVAAGSPVDFRRAGFPSLAAFDSSWRVNHRLIAQRLAAGAPRGFMLIGNCGPSGETDVYNGWMHENWPYQNGGSWDSNMIGTTSAPGYLPGDSLYAQPSMCWISEMPTGAAKPNAEDARRVRWGLGSATLAGGVFTFPWTTRDHMRGYSPTWWDEYAVDANGNATAEVSGKGWLGTPQGAVQQLPNGIWRRDFTRGIVLVNPTLFPTRVSLGAYFQRIMGTADPATNDGLRDSVTVVPGHDALFLRRTLP